MEKKRAIYDADTRDREMSPHDVRIIPPPWPAGMQSAINARELCFWRVLLGIPGDALWRLE